MKIWEANQCDQHGYSKEYQKMNRVMRAKISCDILSHCCQYMVYRNTWLWKYKLFIIDLIVNIILEYLKKTMDNVFTINTNKQGRVLFCKRSTLKLLNKIFEKYLRKTSFLAGLQDLKMNLYTHIFQGFC